MEKLPEWKWWEFRKHLAADIRRQRNRTEAKKSRRHWDKVNARGEVVLWR